MCWLHTRIPCPYKYGHNHSPHVHYTCFHQGQLIWSSRTGTRGRGDTFPGCNDTMYIGERARNMWPLYSPAASLISVTAVLLLSEEAGALIAGRGKIALPVSSNSSLLWVKERIPAEREHTSFWVWAPLWHALQHLTSLACPSAFTGAAFVSG